MITEGKAWEKVRDTANLGGIYTVGFLAAMAHEWWERKASGMLVAGYVNGSLWRFRSVSRPFPAHMPGEVMRVCRWAANNGTNPGGGRGKSARGGTCLPSREPNT